MSTLTEEVRKALGEATPRPWEVNGETGIIFDNNGLALKTGGMYCSEETQSNAHLIANAPTWLAALCDRVEELESDLERIKRSANG